MRTFSRQLSILAFVAAWAIAPAFPSIVCALTLPSGEASTLAEMPDCHSSSANRGASSAEGAHRACCADAATSCCLRALDVDGAVNGLAAHDTAPALAMAAVAPAPVLPPFVLPVFDTISRAHAPPSSFFQVLRL